MYFLDKIFGKNYFSPQLSQTEGTISYPKVLHQICSCKCLEGTQGEEKLSGIKGFTT